MDDMKKKYKKEMNERKKLHNQLQELKGNIRVYMRVRPPNDREIEQHGGWEDESTSLSPGRPSARMWRCICVQQGFFIFCVTYNYIYYYCYY